MENTQNTTSTENDGKTAAILAYITVIGLIIAIVLNQEKKNAFAAYHIRQALGLMVCGLGLGLINVIPILGWIVSFLGFLFLLYLWIMGIMNAANGHMKPVPLLGEKFEEWFKGVK